MSAVQPGSLEAEAGILSCTFDQTGTRLITTESDKTIKIWKEDPDAVRSIVLSFSLGFVVIAVIIV